AVGDRESSNLDVVFRRHDDLQSSVEVAVSTTEGGFLELEGRFVLIRLAANRLVARRPDVARPGISKVDEMRARVRGSVFALPCDGHPAPSARTAAGVCEPHGVTPVRQEVGMRAG